MRLRELLGRAVLLLLSSAVAFGVLEAGFRLAAPDDLVPAARVFDRNWTTLLDCYPSNPRGYFDVDLRDPAARSRYASLAPARMDKVAARAPFAVESRYNTLRFREVEPAPKAARRLVVMGDSFTEGQGVKAADVVTARLQAALPRWEVRNAGRRGTDFPEMRALFEDALRYEPDVLVYAMTLNDAERSKEFDARQSYVDDWIMKRGEVEKEVDAPWSRLFAFVRARLEAQKLEQSTTQWYVDMYGEPNAGGWSRTRAALREMNARQRARGGVFLVTLWPLLVGLEEGYPFAGVHDRIRQACLEDGIAFEDLRPALAGTRASELWVHAVDHHPNEKAHARVAAFLAPRWAH